jgi:creatinine amidohydrolase
MRSDINAARASLSVPRAPGLPDWIRAMIEDWDLSSTNLRRLREQHYEVAVLPIGATEAHNLHLPEGQDVLHATAVARRCCAAAWQRTQSIICLPAIPYGVDCNLLAFPLSIHVAQATLDALVRDIIASLHQHGIRKIVIINAHGGNDFTPLVRDVQHALPVHVFVCDWWKVGLDKYGEIFARPDDHAGEMETSVALALFPELVEPQRAGPGDVAPFRFEALRRGWVRTSRDFARLNDHCAVGDPSRATPEKGRRYLDLVCERIVAFLVELAASPIDAKFPHEA